MTEPRSRLNRILLAAITFMTLAIFGLLALVIWKLFLADNSGDVKSQRVDIGTAAVEYRLAEGCEDELAISDGEIFLTLIGETCNNSQVLDLQGKVSLERK